jgi:hypothetical protein
MLLVIAPLALGALTRFGQNSLVDAVQALSYRANWLADD